MPITATEFSVDKGTFLRWWNIFSDLQHLYEVPLQAVGSLPALPSLPPTVRFTGLELLLDVGLACTRPELADDPERLFALFRYATKISTGDPNMKLISEVSDMDTHKKKVLSDEFGCGFAFLVARHLLNTYKFLDTKTALRQGLVKTASPKSQQPDYIGWDPLSNTLVVLEAKGTQSRGYCRTQIARGCNQIRSVNIPNSVSVTRIAVGVELKREDEKAETTIFVGDPEETEGQEYIFNVPPGEAVGRIHYARVAALIGDGKMLHQLGEYPPEDDGHLQELHADQRTYVGSSFQFRHRDCRDSLVTLFVGIDEDVRNQVIHSAQYDGVLERAIIPDESESADRPQHVVRRPDGTILFLRSKGPLTAP